MFALIIIMALLVLLVDPVLHAYTLLKAVDASFWNCKIVNTVGFSPDFPEAALTTRSEL